MQSTFYSKIGLNREVGTDNLIEFSNSGTQKEPTPIF